EVGGEAVWRWRIDEGQSSVLTLREGHPLWRDLRSFDRLRMQFRISGGEINGLSLDVLGHVSGPRQYKVHQWGLALRTTPKDVWHDRDIDLATPNWFPWDNKDGYGTRRFLRFEA